MNELQGSNQFKFDFIAKNTLLQEAPKLPSIAHNAESVMRFATFGLKEFR